MAVAEQELEARHHFHHRVINDDLDRAAGELEAIVRSKLSELNQ